MMNKKFYNRQASLQQYHNLLEYKSKYVPIVNIKDKLVMNQSTKRELLSAMTDTNIYADGKITKIMDKEFITMLVEQNTMGHGIMMLTKPKESIILLMERNMLGNVKMIKGMQKEFNIILMEAKNNLFTKLGI